MTTIMIIKNRFAKRQPSNPLFKIAIEFTVELI
jgi:hypothetical protein